MQKKIIFVILTAVLVLFGMYTCFRHGYNKGYDKGFSVGYDAGFKEGYKNGNALPVKEEPKVQTVTETKVIYKEIPYNGTDVQVKTEKPVVNVTLNDKPLKPIEQTTSTADLAVKTETNVRLRIPEKRWSIGVGVSDDKSVAYMLKSPLKVGNSDNLGLWVAGSGKKRVMGGVTISF